MLRDFMDCMQLSDGMMDKYRRGETPSYPAASIELFV